MTHQLSIGILLGVASASAANIGVVVEKYAMRRMPPLNARKSSEMIRRLLGNPLWLFGFCIVAFGLVVQVVALSVASISVVQAVAPTGTALLLVLSHIFLGDRLRRAEYFGIAALVVALGLLVLSLDSHSDQATGSASVLALLLVTIPAVGASALFFVLAGRVQRRKLKAPIYGVATGLLYACAALDMKSMSTVMQHSGVVRAVPHIVVSPVFYMFLATSFLVFLMFQMALQRSTTSVFVPVSSVFSTACFIIVGDALFHEHLPRAPLSLSLRLASFALLAAGLVTLAVANEVHDPEEEAEDTDAPAVSSAEADQDIEYVVLPSEIDRGVEGTADEIDQIDLVRLAAEAVDVVQASALAVNVDVAMLPCGEEVPVVGDRALLRQLLADLLANAVTFSFPHARVQVVVDIAGDFGRVRVMDEGREIPSGERAHLFESVLPLAGSGETDASGTGLATVKSAVEAHRGFVGFVDTPGWSTTVQVLIPLRTQSGSETKGIESALYAAGPAPD